jgi:hypothetical protein
VAAGLERSADGDDTAVDPRQLARGIPRALDVLAQESDVAPVLRLDVVDLRALPEPRLRLRARRAARDDRGRQRGEQERALHLGIISAAEPITPDTCGTTASRFSWAQ